MKTKNNIQKTVLAAIFGLIITGFAVKAQFATISLFNENPANQIAMATEKSATTLKSTTGNSGSTLMAAYLAPATDEPLHLEDWMTDENNFSATTTVEAETESPLRVESWMTNENTFGNSTRYLEVETEEELNLEDWMLNEALFSKKENSEEKTQNKNWSISTKKFFYKEVNIEEKLRVEGWMVDPKIWKN